MGATSGGLSAVRGLWHSRVPLEAMGAYVSPDMFGLGRAHEAFNADGAFVDSKNWTRLLENLSNFVAFAEAINPKI